MFNLSFLNSAILVGLLAGIIPILIHLFVKHRPKTVFFSSLRFIKEVQQNKAKIIKLREIILLIIRILIILLLIFALSRPVLKNILPVSNPNSHATTAIVLILDNSFSMNYLQNDKILLDYAKETSTDIMDMLNDKDRVMLLSADERFNKRNSFFTNHNDAKEIISKVSISDNPIPLFKTISEAEKHLDRLDVINKEIYVVTDNQAIAWKDMQKYISDFNTDIFVIPIKNKINKSNIAVQTAMYIPGLLTKSSKPQVRAKIKNYSNRTIENVIASLMLNNITNAEKVISLNPFQSKHVVFDLNVKNENIYFGSIKVKDKLLPNDNHFYFNFSRKQIPQIVVISAGQISSQLSAVLDLITDNSWQKISPSEVSWHILEENRLFILYNLKNFPDKISHFADKVIKNDRSLFIIPGKKLEINFALQKWLNEKNIFYNKISEHPGKIDFINSIHPICGIFTENMFETVHLKKLWELKAAGFSPLLSTSLDLPLLLIKDKLLLASLDFDNSWSNLGYHTIFPVLFYNIGNFLGKERSQLNSYTVGNSFYINESGVMDCKTPTGQVIPLQVQKSGEKFTNTDVPGHYFLSNENGIFQIASYNAPRSESDLTILSAEKINNLENESDNDHYHLHFLNENNWEKNILTSRYGYELWKIILWIVLGLILLEMILSYSGKIIKK